MCNDYNLKIRAVSQGSVQTGLNARQYSNFEFNVTSYEEQVKIGELLETFDSLITLHQRKYKLLI
ncbi:restriction endonuclease subunit S [Mycoplasma testudineum]|uniref:restriction endonuclease subunit S n=1 Tax=Mycoplasma testudineum TaxID=244584 RepID=UPI0014151035|nr:restriction endonuclease subunit S [Mycoplasma testudineum]